MHPWMTPLALKHFLGQGALIAKPETQNAHRLVPIHPVDHLFPGGSEYVGGGVCVIYHSLS